MVLKSVARVKFHCINHNHKFGVIFYYIHILNYLYIYFGTHWVKKYHHLSSFCMTEINEIVRYYGRICP